MIKIQLSGSFQQDYKDLVADNLTMRNEVLNRVELFKRNPNDTRLKNHLLHKRLEDKWAFSVTSDIRVVYEWLGRKTVRLLTIGGHRKVYHE
ncbi:hypothetical protein COW99_05835 [Candidatus Roizmanbacteria bacterium CG22_combo_CG10-13_8_21_14_all_38_20]|uniref:Type II toxin-antitoxin system mRNA interferase toxin, RelE/StbE family n=1 Tax=Candidatus Roizmanbacteria bacterium CG22_combo_CG10-13_8_21_14_all_38_20 TaxID=1974862 RepID=A0A2H0BU28_9BACT|nr:MAG: hypothetical protein COW99_05835 [Candidatus Roizmanbacteria bacterium CG22_combo_CG10-13_8_21_14_all_38_20]PJC32216.1 MAG: hypothetical protein CO050_00555 [Candidatus Roizmanbacteria bacterium CG_4_9_14_0_2_um_filter_38_17]